MMHASKLKYAALLAFAACVFPLSTTYANPNQTEIADLSGGWLFHAGDSPTFAHPDLDDLVWKQVRLPTEFTPLSDRWSGHAWYRQHLQISPEIAHRPLLLSLGPVRVAAEVYLNGVLVGQRGQFGSRIQGDTILEPMQVWLPKTLVKPGDNLLALRIFDPTWDGGVPTGPLLLGPPDAIQARLKDMQPWAIPLRLGLGLFCLALAILQAMGRFSINAKDHIWLGVAGFALSIHLLAGTGILMAIVPVPEMALRLALGMAPIAILGFLGTLVSLYDDVTSPILRYSQWALGALSALILLLPSYGVALLGATCVQAVALIASAFSANLIAKAVRRQEPGSLPILIASLFVLASVAYDGLFTPLYQTMPAWGSLFGVAMLACIAIVRSNQNGKFHNEILRKMLHIKSKLDSRSWVESLDATAAAVTQPARFLDAVIHEIARNLEVRRCSLVLERSDQSLYVAASVGLPKKATHMEAGGSIVRQAFTSGETVTNDSLPESISDMPRLGMYTTQGFVAHPVQYGSDTIGVLCVTDRNDNGDFDLSDQISVSEVAQKLAIVLIGLRKGRSAVRGVVEDGAEKPAYAQPSSTKQAQTTPKSQAKPAIKPKDAPHKAQKESSKLRPADPFSMEKTGPALQNIPDLADWGDDEGESESDATTVAKNPLGEGPKSWK